MKLSPVDVVEEGPGLCQLLLSTLINSAVHTAVGASYEGPLLKDFFVDSTLRKLLELPPTKGLVPGLHKSIKRLGKRCTDKYDRDIVREQRKRIAEDLSKFKRTKHSTLVKTLEKYVPHTDLVRLKLGLALANLIVARKSIYLKQFQCRIDVTRPVLLAKDTPLKLKVDRLSQAWPTYPDVDRKIVLLAISLDVYRWLQDNSCRALGKILETEDWNTDEFRKCLFDELINSPEFDTSEWMQSVRTALNLLVTPKPSKENKKRTIRDKKNVKFDPNDSTRSISPRPNRVADTGNELLLGLQDHSDAIQSVPDAQEAEPSNERVGSVNQLKAPGKPPQTTCSNVGTSSGNQESPDPVPQAGSTSNARGVAGTTEKLMTGGLRIRTSPRSDSRINQGRT